MQPSTLYSCYKEHLSDYRSDISQNKWSPQKIEMVDNKTGEVVEKPVYVFKPENLGENMSIDDKAIAHEGFTILSNNDTSKVALMLESTKAAEVEKAMELFGDDLNTIKNICMDMSPTYAAVCNELIPRAKQVIDKFHVMQYAYDAVGQVRTRIKKDISATLTKGKKKTEEDKQKLSELECLRRIRHAITQSPDKWNDAMKHTITLVFEKHKDLATAYKISQDLKSWYKYPNNLKTIQEITAELYKWYDIAWQIDEFKSVVKMIRKHEKEIINFFDTGLTNAGAERLNGQMNRFVSNNYGVKDKDFVLYRIAGYFS